MEILDFERFYKIHDLLRHEKTAALNYLTECRAKASNNPSSAARSKTIVREAEGFLDDIEKALEAVNRGADRAVFGPPSEIR